MKRCIRCRRVRSLYNFNKDRRYKDARKPVCCKCESAGK